MSATPPLILPLADCRDVALVGGKAANLGALVRAGFPVPGGFAVTTAAYRARGPHAGLPPALADAAAAAYRALGGGAVAVRSSATAEDAAAASMAGQYDTFLHVAGESALLAAVAACWASLDSARTRSYLADRGIDAAGVAMAVVVQRLVAADVAGVVFTADPRAGDRGAMLVEAAWGLGEALVSGRVQPDVLRIDRATGAVTARRTADKRVMTPPGGGGEVEVPPHLRLAACLTDEQARELWRLGCKAAEHFGAEQDLEWAIEGGAVSLLQSRPITTLADADARDELLADAREGLRRASAAGGGPWVRHNLGETLPHPTPLTWSVMRRFMSGAGGFGAMYRLAGFEPSPAVCRDGFLRLIAGRIYMDAAAGPGLFFDGYPYRYDVDALRASPDAAQAPPTVPCGSTFARWRAGRRVAAIHARLARTAADLDRRLRQEVFPSFVDWVAAERGRDLAALSPADLAECWHDRHRRVMDEFAPLSLLPSLVEGMVLGDLRRFLAEHVWDEDAGELATALSSPPTMNLTLEADAELHEVATGERTIEDWVARFGHRAAGEFDLSVPRWREQPEAVRAMAARLAGGANPAARHAAHAAEVRRRVADVRGRLPRAAAAEFDRRLDLVWRHMPFREDGKYYLMLGYELLRDAALEAGRRLGVGEGVFFLTEGELLNGLAGNPDPLVPLSGIGLSPSLGTPGEWAGDSTLEAVIATRKHHRRLEARVSLPHLIDAAALPTLGTPPPLDAAADTHPAFAVSAGVATGPARVVRSPADAGDLGSGYVLVCPSTDPNWTPLFVNAAALVLECGGTLSHGAVVAREMGLPAVVLPDATRLFADGQVLRVDGHHGAVGLAGVADGSADVTTPTEHRPADPADARVAPRLVPPPPGPKCRRAARMRAGGTVVWGLYLAAAFAYPEETFYRPAIGLLDRLHWPLVPRLGMPLTVAAIAAAVAGLTMLLQRVLTDNARLREAKRRAALLSAEAAKLPPGSPRRARLTALAAPVQPRLLGAAMVPLAVLLGPLVMTFCWFPVRVDPASWSPPPGTSVQVVATPAGWGGGPPLTLVAPAPLAVDERTPAVAALEDVGPVEAALRQMLAAWGGPPASGPTIRPATAAAPDPATGDDGQPDPAVAEQIELARAAGRTPTDLKTFLGGVGISAPPVHWTVRTPPDEPGRWPVAVRNPYGVERSLNIVVGDRFPPEPVRAVISDEYGVRELTIELVYERPPPRAFWCPLAGVTWRPVVDRGWDRWDAGWLVTYLLAYLPAMFVARRALRVA